MSPINLNRARPMPSADAFDRWLRGHGASEPEVVVAIWNKRSRRQTVSLLELQEVALCHGWVDSQTKRIDEQRYAIRFVPRRERSQWSEKNRAMARRLIEARRMRRTGTASLPADL
jgi:uncharacterized protein YdeI (YjbR/CyaY-like superfamily)